MLFSKNNISKGLEVYESTAGAILVDVREVLHPRRGEHAAVINEAYNLANG